MGQMHHGFTEAVAAQTADVHQPLGVLVSETNPCAWRLTATNIQHIWQILAPLHLSRTTPRPHKYMYRP